MGPKTTILLKKQVRSESPQIHVYYMTLVHATHTYSTVLPIPNVFAEIFWESEINGLRIVNIKGDTKPADRCDVETLKGVQFPWTNEPFFEVLLVKMDQRRHLLLYDKMHLQ